VSQIVQERVNATAEELEPCAVAAWPARSVLEMGGWLLRFTDGYSHRGNSVAAVAFESGDLHALVALAEMAYFTRGLSPMFQITPASKPADLEELLIDRGYVLEAPTRVMAADPARIKGSGKDARLSSEANAGFKSLVLSGSHSYSDGLERLEIVSRIETPRIFATIESGGEAIACGFCTLMNGWAGINLMRTHPAHRRRGLASEIVAALSRWVRKEGASGIYLQVEDANSGARALYAKAGFVDAYPYRFYRAP
jgi:N-acetylglutamate synthase